MIELITFVLVLNFSNSLIISSQAREIIEEGLILLMSEWQ